MIFRMKQNAVGLANITILAVMAFVAIATSTALYNNTVGQTNQLFPKNTRISLEGKNSTNLEEIYEKAILSPLHRPAEEFTTYESVMVSYDLRDSIEEKVTSAELKNPNFAKVTYSYLITSDDFKKLGNKVPDLAANDILFFKQKGNSRLEKIDFLGISLKVKKNLKTVNHPDTVNTYNPSVIVVKDQKMLDKLYERYNQYSKYPGQKTLVVLGDLNQKEIGKLLDKTGTISMDGKYLGHLEQRAQFKKDFYVISGGFLFTGFILGLSFILGAALIIYYKQYTEGHLDKKSYKILQEVGMSKKQVKKTINSQLLLVFFTPIVFAVLHYMVASVMLNQMLLLFGVTNSPMIYLVSSLTILVIISIYFLIYRLTSRTYYKIIER